MCICSSHQWHQICQNKLSLSGAILSHSHFLPSAPICFSKFSGFLFWWGDVVPGVNLGSSALPLGHASSSFVLVIFEIGSHLMPELEWDSHICASLHSWDDRCAPLGPLVKMESCKLFAWSVLKPWSSWSPPPEELDYRHEPPHPA
jgi:hypothetical protein